MHGHPQEMLFGFGITVAFEIAQMRSSTIGQREGDTAVASSPDPLLR